jgi:hypothetical protein
MWNDWAEKAKKIAADLDKQLNESVGVEESAAPASSASAGGAAAGTLLGTTQEENAWNDDFDEGFDDDDDDDQFTPVAMQEKSAPTPMTPTPMEPPSKTFSPAAAAPVPVPVATQDKQELLDVNYYNGNGGEIVEAASNKEKPSASSMLSMETPVQTPAVEGWDGVDDAELDLDLMEDNFAIVPQPQEPVAIVASPPLPPPMKETIQSISEPETILVEPQSPPKVDAPPSTASPSAASPLAAPAIISSADAPIVNMEDDPRYQQLQHQLTVREEQLTSKSMQLTELQMLWETQEKELRQKIQETKEEAKKRILHARERCEQAENKLASQAHASGESGSQQGEMISALRAEGENLARKQSEMERAVRTASGESRVFKEQLEEETAAKKKALEQIAKLEAELKVTKESLSFARKGESQAGQLENTLLAARSESELKATQVLSLEQQVKELKAESKELTEEIEKARKAASDEASRDSKKLRREHGDVISDLETKLRTSEREAGVREDALRHEVSELRNRWQDAVRRADGAYNMTVPSNLQ